MTHTDPARRILSPIALRNFTLLMTPSVNRR